MSDDEILRAWSSRENALKQENSVKEQILHQLKCFHDDIELKWSALQVALSMDPVFTKLGFSLGRGRLLGQIGDDDSAFEVSVGSVDWRIERLRTLESLCLFCTAYIDSSKFKVPNDLFPSKTEVKLRAQPHLDSSHGDGYADRTEYHWSSGLRVTNLEYQGYRELIIGSRWIGGNGIFYSSGSYSLDQFVARIKSYLPAIIEKGKVIS